MSRSTEAAQSADRPVETRESPVIAGDSLVEEVSIDGMCGVY